MTQVMPDIHLSQVSMQPSPDMRYQQHSATNVNIQQSTQGEENMGNKRSRKTASESAGAQSKNTSGCFHWDSRSTVILIEVKRTHDEGRFHAGIGGKAKTLEEQWVEMINTMARRGVFVDWKVASDKWKRLSQIHKEIADWERNTPSGKNSYWLMTRGRGRRRENSAT